MSKKVLLLSAAAIATSCLMSAPSFAGDIQWSDTYVSLRNQWGVKDPGFRDNINEVALNISYANGWTYGSNFISLDFENFDHHDASNNLSAPPGGAAGSTEDSHEFYGVVRTVLSGNKIFNTKTFSFGPIKDVGLELGFDWCTQNDAFASYKRMIVAGPQFEIDMPKGFWNIGIHVAHEWNNNAYLGYNAVAGHGVSNGTGTNFNAVPELETAWLYPFSIGPVPLKFTGFANVIGPKGYGGSGDTKHETEILVHPKLMVDVGSLVGYQPNKIDAGVGYEYWYNKFGVAGQGHNGSNPPGTPSPTQNSVFVEVGYHW